MKLCRFENASGRICPGLVSDLKTVFDLSGEIESLTNLVESEDLNSRLAELAKRDFPRHPLQAVRLVAPVERQEVWAVGVTYMRSK